MADANTDNGVVTSENNTGASNSTNGPPLSINAANAAMQGLGANNSPMMLSPVNPGPGGANIFHKSPSLYVGDLNQDVGHLFEHER